MWSCVLPAGKVAVEHPLPGGEEEDTAVESRVTSPDGDTDTEVSSYTGTCGSLLISLHNSQRLMRHSGGHIQHPTRLEAKQSHGCLWCGAARGVSEPHISPRPAQPEQGVEREGDAQGSPQWDQTVLGTGGAWGGCGQPWGWFPGSETLCGLQGEASFWVWEVLELSLTRPTQNQAIHPTSALPFPPWSPLNQPLVWDTWDVRFPHWVQKRKISQCFKASPQSPLILQIQGMGKSFFCSGTGKDWAVKPS